MKNRKLTILVTIAAVVILAGGIAIYSQNGDKGQAKDVLNGSGKFTAEIEYTEEEKAVLESQTGVTLLEGGGIEVNVGERQAEEESVTIKREEAESLVLESMSGEADVVSAGLTNQEGVTYWIVQADKGGEAYQVWVEAETGKISRSQRQ